MEKSDSKIITPIRILLAFFLFSCSFFFDNVNAQGDTKLRITPGEANLPIGESTVIGVEVVNGKDLNAFDISIIYEEDIICLESWSIGSYFSNTAVIYNEITPGLIRLAVTQMGSPGANGSGTLFEMVFRGLKVGSSDIEITTGDLVNMTDDLVVYSIENGVIDVINKATPTLTLVKTSTLTKTPTPTITPTMTSPSTPTRTVTPVNGLTQSQMPWFEAASTNATGFSPDNPEQMISPGSETTPVSITTTNFVSIDADSTARLNDPNNLGESGETENTLDHVGKSIGSKRFLNWFLWGIVGLSLIALGAMLIVYLHRKSKRLDD